jgi:hypothetical protein
MLQRSAHELVRSCVFLSSSLGAVALLWGLVALAIPDSLGESLLGETWTAAQVVLLPMTVMVVCNAASVGAMTGLRVLQAATTSLHVRTASSVLTVAGGLIGAWLGNAEGAAWGLAGAAAISLPVWWRAFLGRADKGVGPATKGPTLDQVEENSPSTSLP